MASILHRFDFEPQQILCLRTLVMLVSAQNVLAGKGSWKRFSLSVLAQFVSTVVQGRIPTIGRFHLTVRRLSSYKCTHCKSLWIKAFAKRPECICNIMLVLVSSPLLDLSLIVSHIVCSVAGGFRWFPVETHSMSFNASTDTHPRNMIGRITSDGKENETTRPPRYELVYRQDFRLVLSEVWFVRQGRHLNTCQLVYATNTHPILAPTYCPARIASIPCLTCSPNSALFSVHNIGSRVREWVNKWTTSDTVCQEELVKWITEERLNTQRTNQSVYLWN